MPPRNKSRRNAVNERQRRLFMLLDALLVMNDDDNRELFNILSDMDALSSVYYYPPKLDELRKSISRKGGGGEQVYFGSRNCCMRPDARFALTKEALADVELKLRLRKLFVDKKFLQSAAGRGAAQIAAIYNNDEAVFRESIDNDWRNLDAGSRRDHILYSSITYEWVASRKPFLQAVILSDLCSGFVNLGFLHPLLGSLYEDYEKGKISCPWLDVDKQAVMAYWRGNVARAEELLQGKVSGKKDTDRHQAISAGIISLFQNNPESLKLLNKAVAAFKRQEGTRQNLFFGQMFGLALGLARFLFGDRKELEYMRESNRTLSESRIHGYMGFTLGNHGFSALQALDNLRCGNKGDGVLKLVDTGGPDGNFLSVLLASVAQLRMEKTENPRVEKLMYWHAMADGLPRLQRLFADVLHALPDYADKDDWERPDECAGLLNLTSLVEDMPDWLMRLTALEHLAKVGGEEERKKRLIWVVDVNENSVRPLEQTLGVRGWSKGREVSLKRLTEKHGDVSFFTEADWRIASAIETNYWWGSHYVLRISSCCDGLAMCNRVFENVNGELKPLTFKEGKLRFVLKEAGKNSYTISFAHDISDLEASTVYFLRDGDVVHYYKLTSLEEQVARVVGKGMTFPKEELPRILNLTRSTLKLDVATEGVKAETVEEVLKPVLQLEQTAAGFEAVAGVRPFGRSDTTFFRTGQGPAEPIVTVSLEEPVANQANEGQGGEGKTGSAAGGKADTAVPVLTKTLRVVRDFEAEESALDKLASTCPTLAQGLENGQWLSGNPEEVLALLEELRKSPVESSVEWPKGMRLKLRGQLDASMIKAKIGWQSNDWFGVDGSAMLDDNEFISLSHLLQAMKGSRFVSLGEGEYVALTEDLRRRLSSLKLVGSEGKHGEFLVNSLASAAVEQALGDMEIEADPKWENNVERMHKAFATTPQIPSLLHADLREYQREGYEWMQRLAIWGVGGCLADDMGLGKTLQAIAVMLNQATQGACLVVAPTSVCGNWELEIGRFAPSLNVVRLGHVGRSEAIKALGVNDVLIVGYGLLPNVQEELAGRTWSMVVFDEAQALKNAATKRAKASRKIEADFRLALTGTPIENRIDDLWSLFNIINPGLLGSWENFSKRYGRAATPGTPASRALRAVVRPFLLRRLKSAVLDELPEKTEQNIVVEPNPKEAAFYETLRRKAVDKLQNSDSRAGARRIEILAELTRLRRACCHPGLADPDMMALEKHSSKTLMFLETVEDLISGGHKVLAFSQFTSYLAQIRAALEEKNISYQYLDGQTPEAVRRERVAAFQRGEGNVFLLSLKAGGTGLNLTAADYVIHLDPWWNPAVEDQASDRAHRIGQKRPVTIYRMVQQGSVEEKILSLHQSKRELAADFLEGTETSVKSLTEEELLHLLQ